MPSTMQNEVHLPLIDISQFPFDFEGDEGLNNLQYHPGIATVREACKKWGFFRVVNAGIAVENVESLCHQLCAMPQEVKETAITSNPFESYVRTPNRETFRMLNLPHSDSVHTLCHKIWAEKGNSNFCETIGAYAFGVADLQRKISTVILASLGLDVKTFYHSDFEECTAYMRINHYFCHGKSTEEEEALFTHTDIGCFSILYQDNEGGLQIRSEEGKWFNVNPLIMKLLYIINIHKYGVDCRHGATADTAVQSIGVVYKGWTDRISVPWFVHFPNDTQIWAPTELVDDDHPWRYGPFTIAKFKQDVLNNYRSKEENPATFIESYACISGAY